MQIISAPTRLVILPPSSVVAPRAFRNIRIDNGEYDFLLAGMQRLRGSVYLSDGAITADELTPRGSHEQPEDTRSWHVLAVDEQDQVRGCLRYMEERETSDFEDLWISNTALARCPAWGARFRRSVEAERVRARRLHLSFGVVGGWAVAEDRRCSVEALRIILATYALLELLGGCLGLATATVRHGSAGILRRIGLSSLMVDGQEVPPYYDPRYRCEMEALRFDSAFPNAKYHNAVQELCSLLATAPVICRKNAEIERQDSRERVATPVLRRLTVPAGLQVLAGPKPAIADLLQPVAG